MTKNSPSASQHGHPVRLLLINPRFPESFWSFRFATEQILPGNRVLNPPLGLATLAALCPPHWQVQIVDENIEPIPFAPDADIVGVCGMGVQFRRQRELLAYYRDRGYYTVAGGSYASLCPEKYHDLVDTVVAGEAEYIWPRYCTDFEAGRPAPLYQETGTVDIADSPPPRFDLLKLDRYTTVSLQFSRGCPFRCEFCDIIVMFGRRPRTKTPEQIGRELDLLRTQGANNVFFVDDNLIGNKAKAKELLIFLRDYQRRHAYRFQFGTEVSLNVAEDAELLGLLREANFTWVFIGVESPDPESLREIKKTQNMRQDLLGAVRTIYRNGIDVLAGFIVGFDNDRAAAFEHQYRFIMHSGIQVAMVGLLTALPKTPLYERLAAEGRLLHAADDSDNTKAGTNFIPKRMDYGEMVHGYKDLYRRLLSDRGIAERIRNKLHELRQPNYQNQYSLRERVSILARLLFRGVLPGGPRRLYWFVRTLISTKPATWPQLIVDWIAGLSLRAYAERYLAANPVAELARTEALRDFIRRRWAACLRRGDLEVQAILRGQTAELAVTFWSGLDARFFRRTARRLEKLLKGSSATLTLQIETLREAQRKPLHRLLRRLANYGDRVSIRVSDHLRHLLPIDSSKFHLVLTEPTAPR